MIEAGPAPTPNVPSGSTGITALAGLGAATAGVEVGPVNGSDGFEDGAKTTAPVEVSPVDETNGQKPDAGKPGPRKGLERRLLELASKETASGVLRPSEL